MATSRRRAGYLVLLLRGLLALGLALLADYYNPFSPTGPGLHPGRVVLATALVVSLTLWQLYARLTGREAAPPSPPSERVQDWAEGAGCRLHRIERRFIRLGPFFWTTSTYQTVFRVACRDAEGRERTGWARVGSFFGQDASRVEVRWDEAGPAQTDP